MATKTPVISASKLRQSLSAKKKPQKVQLRNVLAQPFSRYWPEISADEASHLIDSIHDTRLTNEDDDAPTSSLWKSPHCTIGLNAALRLIQKPMSVRSHCDLLLLSADIRPKFVVEQILVLALSGNRKLHCFLVPGLRELLSNRLGISSCMCVALQRIRNVSAFSAVGLHIAHLARKHPIPDQYHRQTWRDTKTIKNKKAAPTIAEHNKSSLPATTVDDGSLYIQRTDDQPQRRAFIPAGTVFRTESSDNWSDYIGLVGAASSSSSLSQTPTANKMITKKMSALELMKRKMKVPKVTYIGLTVNRVQSNPNKIKPLPTQKSHTAKNKRIKE